MAEESGVVRDGYLSEDLECLPCCIKESMQRRCVVKQADWMRKVSSKGLVQRMGKARDWRVARWRGLGISMSGTFWGIGQSDKALDSRRRGAACRSHDLQSMSRMHAGPYLHLGVAIFVS